MFTVTVSQEQGKVPITVFHIQGSVNLESAPKLDLAIKAAFENGSRDVLLDMTEVTAMTSAGLRVMLIAYRLLDPIAANARGAVTKTPHLKLLKPSANLREVMHIAGFDAFLDVQENMADAISSF